MPDYFFFSRDMAVLILFGKITVKKKKCLKWNTLNALKTFEEKCFINDKMIFTDSRKSEV